MKKYRLRRWVKNLLWILLGALIGIIIYQMFTIRTVEYTPVGSYECSGGIIKICSTDSNDVANYLGV